MVSFFSLRLCDSVLFIIFFYPSRAYMTDSMWLKEKVIPTIIHVYNSNHLIILFKLVTTHDLYYTIRKKKTCKERNHSLAFSGLSEERRSITQFSVCQSKATLQYTHTFAGTDRQNVVVCAKTT